MVQRVGQIGLLNPGFYFGAKTLRYKEWNRLG